MKNKRQRGTLHNVHTRIPEKEFQRISELCEKLGITQAQFFNAVIHADGYESLLVYAKKINRDPRPCRLEISEEAVGEIKCLTGTLNTNTSQLRRIGTNLAALVRDIRSGTVPGDRNTVALLEHMKAAIDAAIVESHVNSTRLAALLYDENAIAKIETVYKNCWGEVAYREVMPSCTPG